jgi:hypothetical protein
MNIFTQRPIIVTIEIYDKNSGDFNAPGAK